MVVNIKRAAQKRGLTRVATKSHFNISYASLDRLRHLLSFEFTPTTEGIHTPLQVGDEVPKKLDNAQIKEWELNILCDLGASSMPSPHS